MNKTFPKSAYLAVIPREIDTNSNFDGSACAENMKESIGVDRTNELRSNYYYASNRSASLNDGNRRGYYNKILDNIGGLIQFCEKTLADHPRPVIEYSEFEKRVLLEHVRAKEDG
jgi:hypothetical protein